MNRKTQIVLMTLCMALLLAWGGFSTAQAADSYAQWDFNDNLNSSAPGGQVGTVDAGVALNFVETTIDGQTAKVAEVTDIGNDNQYVNLPFNFDPNGGQTDKLGRFTVISDVMNPNMSGWGALQPSINYLNMSNTYDDYMDNTYGYMSGWVSGPHNVMNSGEWTRVVMAVDKTKPTGGIKYYFNGQLAGTCDDTNETEQSSLLPTTHIEIGASRYSNYTSGYQFNSIQVLPYTLSEAQIVALGGPKAAGIPAPNPPAPVPPAILVGSPSVLSTLTGPVDFPAACDPGVPAETATVNLTPDKVSLLPSEGTVTGTVEITGGTTLNPTIRVKDITGFGKLRISVLPGTASNSTGPARGAGPSRAVNVYPPLPDPTPPTAPATGSKLWWDASNINGSNNAGLANGAAITSWKDRSGNNNDGTPTGTGATYTASVAGFNNKPAVTFHADKANEEYNFATGITDVRTVFWAIQKGDAGLHYILGCNTWGGGYGWHGGDISGVGDGEQIWHREYAAAVIQNGVTRVNGDPVNGTQTSMFPLGYTIISLEAAGDCTADFFSGDGRDESYTQTRSWVGDLAELIIYNRLLTADERNTTGRYLAGKYAKNTSFGYPDAPVVTLVYPAGTVAVPLNTTVDLKATAVAGAGARIAAVEFYVDWQLVGTVTTPNAAGEYIFPWTTPGSAESHDVFARALDNRTPALAAMSAVGTIAASAPMFVTTTGTGSGASWADAASLANAFSLSEGIIYMKAGTYNVPAPLSPPVPAPSLALYGGFAGTETTPADRAPTGNETILDGVTTDHQILVASLPTTLDRLTFKRGKATRGGAVGATTALTINNCRFQDNVTDGGWWDNGGAAVHVAGNNVTISNSTFTNNTMPVESDGVGGAIVVLGTSATGAVATIRNCVFTGNSSGQGGAAQIYNCPVAIDSCWFEGNWTTQDNLDGGALHFWLVSQARVTNCVFKNNTAFRHGGAICLRGSGGYFVNNTFVGNVNSGTDSASDGIWERSLDGELGAYYANNIFTGHADNAVGTDYAAPTLIVMKNNLLQTGGNGVAAGIVVSGTITGNPLFVSAADFHLQTGSPALNAGTIAPYTLPNGLAVAYPPRDYSGLLRFDGQPDLGAYEIAVIGTLAVTPDPLSFGVVVKETISTQTLTLTNAAGNTPITISAITLAGAGFALVAPPTLPVTLLAGESLSLRVTFTAPVVTSRVPHSGTVTVVNTGAVTPVVGSLKAIAAPSLFPGEPPTVVVERSDGTPATTKVFPIEFNITFSEGVTGFELGDIEWAAGDVKVGNITATLIPREASGAQYTVRITEITGMGAGTWTVNPVVPAGVCETIGKYANEASNTDAVVTYETSLFGAVITTTAPEITDAATVTCTVTFDTPVKAVDALALIESKLSVAGTSAGASIASVLEANPSTAYTVEITTGGDGTLALALNDDDAIMDLTDAPLNGTGSSVIHGPTIEVDKTAPTVVAIQRAFGAARGTNETTVIFEVTFSDIVTDVDADDFTIACSDATADVASVAALGNTALVVCNVKAAVGPYALSVKTAATMTNRVGLDYATGTPDPNEDYYILTQAPSPTSAGTWTLY